MEKYFEEWNGESFPVRKVLFEVCEGLETHVKVADFELWSVIEDACENEEHPQHKEARELREDIYYFCDSGFIASDPTDEEIVEYLIDEGC